MTTAPTPIPHHRHHLPHPSSVLLLGVLLAVVATGSILALRWDGGSSTSSTLEGSGVAAVQTRAPTRFTGVDLAAANDVTIRVGGAQAVTVRGDDNLLEYVTTRVLGGILVIDQSRSFTTRSPLSVEIAVPSLDALVLSGAGRLGVTGVHAGRFLVHVPGSGELTVSGTATTLDATLSGSGDVLLGELVARDVTAKVAGTGRLEVDATRSLHATVSGRGAIVYGGDPAEVTKNVTGTGAITAR